MVSFWPWKGDDTASFEKVLSSLSERIKKANVKQDRLRTSSRRYKVLWTLYSSLAYLVIALVLVLVTGWQSWGPLEYTSIAGGPVLIYLIRTALNTLYTYRLSSNQTYLDSLNAQRDEAIEKFKNATKYNSTQQLLEKYGAAPKQPPTPPAQTKRKAGGSDGGSRKATPQRTNIPPPPTANIRRPGDPSPQSSPMQNGPSPYYSGPPPPQNSTPARSANNSMSGASPSSPDTTASFAPNAFTTASTSTPQYSDPAQHQWYDRIFDVLLGEDETRASNRLALVCQHCKLVNGQAPPGVKRVEDIGRWRCAECRGWNGVESVLESSKSYEPPPESAMAESASPADHMDGEPGPAVDADADEADVAEDSEEDAGNESAPPAKSTRSRKKYKAEEED